MRYILSRLMQMLVIVIVLSIALFGLLSAMPGNPVDMLIMSNPRIKAEDVIRIKKLRGLDKPWYTQYYRWMWGYHDGYPSPKVDLTPYLGKPDPKLQIDPIPTQIVDDPNSFSVNLMPFVHTPDHQPLQFKLLNGPGKIDTMGIYTHLFEGDGQAVIEFSVSTTKGKTTKAAFLVDIGPIPNPAKFNKGFLFFFTGDTEALGFSSAYKRPVWELLAGGKGTSGNWFVDTITNSGRISSTLQLMIPAVLLSLLFALPLGIWSAYRQYSWLDYLVNFWAFVGISLPVFWFAIMVLFVFAEYLQWFPASGMQTPDIDGHSVSDILLDKLDHAVLPTLVLSIAYIGRWLRYMRAAMLEVLPADYIRTARAKGLGEGAVILKHALRNALIPIVTILALSIPALFGGAVLTETVFAWPGLGRLQYDAVINNDYYVAIVVFLISAALVMVGNLFADILYVVVDPRMREK